MRIFVSAKADTDLLQLFSYLSAQDPAVAEATPSEIDEKFASLSRFPFIGRERATFGQGIRSLVAGMYVIFYAVEKDRIVIVRVLDGSRDLDAELQK